MTTSGKIRLMLALLCASLLFTAIIVQKTYTPVNNLDQSAKTLENNLHKKERYVNEVINDPHPVQTIKNALKSPGTRILRS